MGSFSAEAKNYMLDQRLGTGSSSGTWAALVNGAPADATDAKTKELTGGTPAYARKQANIAAAAVGSKALAASMTFDIPAGLPFTHVAWWRVATTGADADYIGSDALSQSESAYAAQGTYVLNADSFSITG